MRKPVYSICEQHSRSLISAFVVHCLDSIIPTLVKSKISRLWLVSGAEQTSLSHTGSQIPEDRFSRDEALMFCYKLSVLSLPSNIS